MLHDLVSQILAAMRKARAQERRRAERERAIRECMDDRDGDPDADREICESEL